MKIAIFGSNACADFFAQRLLEDDRVKMIYHVKPSFLCYDSDRYTVIDSEDIKDAGNIRIGLDFLETTDADMVLATNLTIQMWPEFHEICNRRNILKISPDHSVGIFEWSKIEGKKLLKGLGIPTPNSKSMKAQDLVDNFFTIPRPYVIKFERDWRAGLQTVVVTDDSVVQEYENLLKYGLKRNLNKEFGEYVDQYVSIEDFIEGIQEYSWHAVFNNTSWKYIGSARDYKKRYEYDQGFNTSGMGSYSPVKDVDIIINEYANKLWNYFRSKNIDYRGFLYLGIMIGKDKVPYVLEINTRPGDPEIQSIIPTMKNNLVDLLYDIAQDQLLEPIELSGQTAVSLRLVNKDYSLDLVPNTDIRYPDLYPNTGNIYIQHNRDRALLNSVLTVVDEDIEKSRSRLYEFLKNKDMGDFVYRTDIGYYE